eukprot:COSAG01_NODE_10445_length_2164_cov_1.567070_3_plen_150_part_00
MKIDAWLSTFALVLYVDGVEVWRSSRKFTWIHGTRQAVEPYSTSHTASVRHGGDMKLSDRIRVPHTARTMALEFKIAQPSSLFAIDNIRVSAVRQRRGVASPTPSSTSSKMVPDTSALWSETCVDIAAHDLNVSSSRCTELYACALRLH